MKTQRDIPVVFYQEAGKWLAQSLGVEVASFGDTLDEANAAIKEACNCISKTTTRSVGQ